MANFYLFLIFYKIAVLFLKLISSKWAQKCDLAYKFVLFQSNYDFLFSFWVKIELNFRIGIIYCVLGASKMTNQQVNTTSPQWETDVIIIGGGATGAGIARDCSLRGLRSILLERRDIATGATGRNHGLLHSGARYAVNDHESAEECIKENMILKQIARHCVEDTKGLFITLPEDDLNYQKTFIESCQKAGIEAVQIEPDLAKR